MKTAVKNLARRFGYDIRRHNPATEAGGETQLIGPWIRRLTATGPMDVMFDIGANDGVTVAMFRKAFPTSTIYAFEPSSTTFARLQANTANDRRVRIVQAALGDYEGSATLHENADDVTNSLLQNSTRLFDYAPRDMCEPRRDSTVPITRLDSFCAQEGIARIDILKVDAQGYERQVLAGAGDLLKPATIRGLVLELQFIDAYQNQIWGGEIIELLRARGYRLFGMTAIHYDETSGWKWADALFLGDA